MELGADMRVSKQVLLTSLVHSQSLVFGSLELFLVELVVALGVILARRLHHAPIFGVLQYKLVADLLQLLAQHVSLNQRVLHPVLLVIYLVYSVLDVLEVCTCSNMNIYMFNAITKMIKLNACVPSGKLVWMMHPGPKVSPWTISMLLTDVVTFGMTSEDSDTKALNKRDALTLVFNSSKNVFTPIFFAAYQIKGEIGNVRWKNIIS